MTTKPEILVFIPTYNERNNVEKIYHEISSLNLGCDILFIDDGSPDGTGEILDHLAKSRSDLIVKHRKNKNGIGSAHLDGISYAYQHHYAHLITMDADFTHEPIELLRLLEEKNNADVIMGSRYMKKNSLPGWSFFRRCLTHFGHLLTKYLLGINQDASGAFRLYNLKKIPPDIFKQITSNSYSFFFESLFILKSNGYLFKEIPISLSARTYGHSKMNFKEAFKSGMFLIKLAIERMINPGRFQYSNRDIDKIDHHLQDDQGWDKYWDRKKDSGSFIYEIIASLYRKIFIKRNLNKYINRNFSLGSKLLHAGCGSGQVDMDLHDKYRITAIDLSVEALKLYAKNNPTTEQIEQADLLNLSFDKNSFDGIYNLGVMEHFSKEDLYEILKQFKNILKSDGKLLIFWPHKAATSVFVLRIIHYILNKILRKNIRLHPEEPLLLHGKKMAIKILQAAGFDLIDYHFNISDLFVQAIVLAKPNNEKESD